MPVPINAKKQILMKSGKLRRALRAAGHHLSPVVQVGADGVSSSLKKQVLEQVNHHELIKVRVGSESPEDRHEVAERLGENTGSQVAQVLGRTILLYKKNPKKARYEPNSKPRPLLR